METLGPVKRKANGTGKIFRQTRKWPEERVPLGNRRYARYGITEESLSRKIASVRPDLILITSGMTYWYEGVQESVELCRRIHPDVPVAVGGIYATLMEEHCRRVCRPDYVLTGEGEKAVRNSLGEQFPLPEAPLTCEADWDDPVWRDSAVIRLNRGCPMKCEYCASRLLEPRFLPGDPDDAFQQVKYLYEKWGTGSFAFYDDALLVHSDRLIKPFLEKILSWGEQVSFFLPNAVHARYIDGELLELMARTGFREIRMGYESSSDDFHARHDGKIDRDVFEHTIELIKKSSFPLENCAAYVLAGLPGQRGEEVEKSVRTGSSYGIRCRIAQYSPVPGSALWKDSLTFSSLPLEEEPVYHNSTFFSMEWEKFTRDDLEKIKSLSRELSPC